MTKIAAESGWPTRRNRNRWRTAQDSQMMAKTKVDKRAKGFEFRNLILARLKAEDRSNYWLANKVAEKHPDLVTADAIYRYLRGETDATGAVIAACFTALKIEIPKHRA